MNKGNNNVKLSVGDTSNWKKVLAWNKDLPRHKKYTMQCIKCGYTTETSIKSFYNSCKKCSSHRIGKNLRTPEETMWFRYKLRAEKENIVFSVSKKVFSQKLHEDCFYCGKPPQQKLNLTRKTDNKLIYNGIDRKENIIGYTNENVVACCWVCNQAKKNYSLQEWKSMIKKWAERLDSW